MPVSLIVGLAAVAAVVLLVRWFVSTEVGEILRTLKWASIGLLLVVGVVMLVTGRLGWAVATVAALSAWGMRLFHLHRMIKALRHFLANAATGGFTATAGAKPRRGHPSGGGASVVHSRFLRMTLDHDTGEMTGRVLTGTFAGRRLDELSRADLMKLINECLIDEESTRLLEAWLDRAHPDWHAQTGGHEKAGANGNGASPSPPGGMSREEALSILGLEAGANPDEVRKAYRRLMDKVHPDHGGSSYLAAQINRAKDILLGSR